MVDRTSPIHTSPIQLNSAALWRAGVHPRQTREIGGSLTGAGIVLCLIDYGFDLCHPTLRTATGETRFAALIDQNGVTLGRAAINRLLRTCERTGDRAALDAVYDPHAHYFGSGGVTVGAHGSWVASIAAGSRTAVFSGVAPAVTLIGVQLDLPDQAWREIDEFGRPSWLAAAAEGGAALRAWRGWRSYEDSRAIAAALHQAYVAACALRPDGIVFNLSIGAWAGGHDPGSRVNRAIAALGDASARPGAPSTVVVAATGNAGADSGHVAGHMTATRPFRFAWSFAPPRPVMPRQTVASSHTQPGKLEIWAACAGDVTVEIRLRTGSGRFVWRLAGASRGTSAIVTADGRLVGIAENRGAVRRGLRAVRIILHPSLPVPPLLTANGCTFDVSVRAVNPCDGGAVHAWLERDEAVPAAPTAKLYKTCKKVNRKVEERCTNSERILEQGTLSGIACAPFLISVAGLDQTVATDTVIAMSGRGPRPWPGAEAVPAPLLAAPAVRLFGARSKTSGYMRGSGTSAAAAMVSGACALALQAADRSGRRLGTAGLVDALLGHRNVLLNKDKWRSDIGFGALCFDPEAARSGGHRAGFAIHSDREQQYHE